jgi:ABC-type multidrug transport system fused ATPase/permease subunit
VYKKESNFIAKFRAAVDENSAALLHFVTAQRWLGVRIELLGSVVVLMSSVLVVCLNEVLLLAPGIGKYLVACSIFQVVKAADAVLLHRVVGLLIIWSSNFTITLGFLIDTFGEAEAAITAIERVDAMAHLPKERPMITDYDQEVPPSWPSEGCLQFRDVCLRYREGLPLALDNLTFRIPAGKSVGVVGRTGAGKPDFDLLQ